MATKTNNSSLGTKQLKAIEMLAKRANLENYVDAYINGISDAVVRTLIKRELVENDKRRTLADAYYFIRLTDAGRAYATERGWLPAQTAAVTDDAQADSGDGDAVNETLTVWWKRFCQGDNESEEFEVGSLAEAITKLNELADYDMNDNGVIFNIGGLRIGGDDWQDDNGDDIWDFMEAFEAEKARATQHTQPQAVSAGDAPIKCEHGIVVPYCAECFEDGCVGKTYRANQLMTAHQKRQAEIRRKDNVDPLEEARATIAALTRELADVRAANAALVAEVTQVKAQVVVAWNALVTVKDTPNLQWRAQDAVDKALNDIRAMVGEGQSE